MKVTEKQVNKLIKELEGRKRESNYLSNSSSIGHRYHEGVRDGFSASLVLMRKALGIPEED